MIIHWRKQPLKYRRESPLTPFLLMASNHNPMALDLFGMPLPVPEPKAPKKGKPVKTSTHYRYAEFGLDSHKRIHDAGRAGSLFCPWCQETRSYGYSLCFVNWVICPECVKRGLAPGTIMEAEECFSCRSSQIKTVFLSTGEGFQVGICLPCLHRTEDALEKQKNAPHLDKKGQYQMMLSPRL